MPFWLSLPTVGEEICNFREGVEINIYLHYFIDFAKTPQRWPHPTPCKEALGGAVILSIKTTPLEGEMAPSWWRCLCACV